MIWSDVLVNVWGKARLKRVNTPRFRLYQVKQLGKVLVLRDVCVSKETGRKSIEAVVKETVALEERT